MNISNEKKVSLRQKFKILGPASVKLNQKKVFSKMAASAVLYRAKNFQYEEPWKTPAMARPYVATFVPTFVPAAKTGLFELWVKRPKLMSRLGEGVVKISLHLHGAFSSFQSII